MNDLYKYPSLLVLIFATIISISYGRSAPELEGLVIENQNCRYTDSLALVELYNSTDGANWKSRAIWDLNQAIDTWHGVTLNDNGCVTVLNLFNSGLVNDLPPELGNLSQLTALELALNRLNGTIPIELGNLSQLTVLNIEYNYFLSGTIPPELGNLSQLTELVLTRNQLSGEIPPELGNLIQLTSLHLGGNQLSGKIPRELGHITTLDRLSLGGNQLSGEIPGELGNLIQLRSLDLGSNQLSGKIPPELGHLSQLIALYLGSNQLSGRIPPKLGNLSSLFSLYLDNNELTGLIPPTLGNIYGLQLFLNNNSLRGCFDEKLLPLCSSTRWDMDINEGNNFNVSWEDFCSSNGIEGVCTGACPPVINLLGSLGDSTHHARSLINTDANVPSGFNPILKAGVAINILSGFNVQSGSTISFEIEACRD